METLIQRDKIILEKDDLGNPILNKTGTEEWIKFAKASEVFAKTENSTYPKEGDICLLCHQSLDVPSISLIKRFWGFVNSAARLEAEKLNKEIDRSVNDLESLNLCLLPKDSVNRDKLNSFAQDALNIFDIISNELTERRNAIISALKNSENSSFPSNEYAFKDTIVSNIIRNLETKLKELHLNGNSNELVKLDSKKSSLKHSIILDDNINLIDDYITEIRWISRANSAISEINTSHITTTSKSLYSKVITDKYKHYLKSEEENLRFKLPYDLKHFGKSGKNMRKYQVKENFKTTDIFSEGEQRILSLADFLVETKINQNSSAIILDDPVVSFDFEKREMIAKRLVKESITRQVIVLTHDIVFLYNLIENSQKKSMEIQHHLLVKGHNDSINILINQHPEDIRKKTKVDEIQNSLNKANNDYNSNKDYNRFVTELRNCADQLRGFIENFVSRTVFNDVVKRFDKSIHMDNLKSVKIDKNLTKDLHSLFEDVCRVVNSHDQSYDAEPIPPTLNTIQEFIDRMKTIIAYRNSI